MTSHRASFLAVFSLLVLLTALLYKKHHDDQIHARLDHTLNSLLQVEDSFSINNEAKVALGYGSCVDIVSSARNVITSHWEPPDEMQSFAMISNEDELIQSFAYFYTRGAAAE
jgi:ADP-dependent glucokinase